MLPISNREPVILSEAKNLSCSLASFGISLCLGDLCVVSVVRS